MFFVKKLTWKTSAVFHVSFFFLQKWLHCVFPRQCWYKIEDYSSGKNCSRERSSFFEKRETYIGAILVRKQYFLPVLVILCTEMNMYMLCLLNKNLSGHVHLTPFSMCYLSIDLYTWNLFQVSFYGFDVYGAGGTRYIKWGKKSTSFFAWWNGEINKFNKTASLLVW